MLRPVAIAPQVVPPVSANRSRRPEIANAKTAHPDASEHSKQPADGDGEDDPKGFNGVLKRALHHRETTTPGVMRLRLAMPPSPDAKVAPKTSANDATAGPTPPPVADNSNVLPLSFSIPAALRDKQTAPAKAEVSAGPSDTASIGSQDKPDAPERLQIDQPQAFTARIKPVNAQPTGVAAIQNAADNAVSPQRSESDSSEAPKFIVETVAAPAPAASPEVHGPSTSTLRVVDAQPVAEIATVAPAHPQPLHDISFQLPGARGVEVRLSEHGGVISVDVRSPDPGLTQDLRSNLHELVTGLEHKGFSAQVAHAGETRSGNNADSNSSKGQDQSQQDQSQQDQSQQEQNRGSGRQQQDQWDQHQHSDSRSPRDRAAKWTEALNSNLEMRPQ